MQKHGNDVNLNCIDTSAITDMSELFSNSEFCGDISEWNVGNVKNMSIMFYGCPFNGDVSKWDVSKVESMYYMFHAAINFDGNISKWDVSKVEDMTGMFCHAVNFKCDISKWNVADNVKLSGMFTNAPDFPIEFMPGLDNRKNFITKEGIECTIRPAKIEDASFVGESVNKSIDDKGNLKELIRLAKTKDTLYDFRNALIAEVEGRTVGCIIAYEGGLYWYKFHKTWTNIPFEPQTISGEYHIDSLYVILEFQHQSIANHLCDMAKAVGEMRYAFNRITTLVSPSNGSLVYFYAKNGYRYAGSRNLWGVNYFLMSKNCQHRIMPKPNEPIEFCVGQAKFKMIYVEAQGNQKPFYISETVVTKDLWDAVMRHDNGVKSGFPKTDVSRDMAEVFLMRLANTTFCSFRLPTAAEWQWAAKGGVNSQGYTYAGSNEIDEVAWFRHNSSNHVHEVAQKKPNELGLYDMSGNVWEMTTSLRSDPKYHNFNVHVDEEIGTYSSKETPKSSIYCGGAYYDGVNACSIDKVGLDEIQWRSPGLGFRLVCDVD